MLLAEFRRIFFDTLTVHGTEKLAYIYKCLIKLLAAAEYLHCGHTWTAAVINFPQTEQRCLSFVIRCQDCTVSAHLLTKSGGSFTLSYCTYQTYISVTLLTSSFLIVSQFQHSFLCMT